VFTKENIKMAEKRKNINIRRTAQILKSFNQNPKGWGVSALASRLGLAKSVVFEILNTLVDEGLIKKNEKEKMYLCGNELLKLALTHFSNIDLIKISRPVLIALSKEIQETVILSQIIDNINVVIEKVDGTEPLRYTVDVGSALPLDKGSSAKVCLAFLPDEKKKELIDKYKININELKEDLEIVKKKGFAISKEEVYSGVNAITAPIFNSYDELVATLGIGGPSLRYNKENEQSKYKIISKILAAAEKVSVQMGFLKWKWS
jgi:DNA-binding IclR family transcriptional regulator